MKTHYFKKKKKIKRVTKDVLGQFWQRYVEYTVKESIKLFPLVEREALMDEEIKQDKKVINDMGFCISFPRFL